MNSGLLFLGLICCSITKISSKGPQLLVLPPNKPYPGSPANEVWDYSEVRPGSSFFWWLYKSDSYLTDPLIIFLHGGPGVSATAAGNFGEVGPYDLNFNPRSNRTSWVKYASVVFVDAPAATGFSFLTNPTAYSFTKEAAADDLVVWFQDFIARNPFLRRVPIHIFAESFGTRFAVLMANKLYPMQRSLGVRIKSLILVSTFASLLEVESTYGPYLYAWGLMDDVQRNEIDVLARVIDQSMQKNDTMTAMNAYNLIDNLYQGAIYGTYPLNIMYDQDAEIIPQPLLVPFGRNFYPKLQWVDSSPFRYAPLMNGPVKQYLSVPSVWGLEVLPTEGTMLPYDRFTDLVPDIDYLLTQTDISIALIEGQLDLYLNIPGQNKWRKRLKWPYLQKFMNQKREIFDGQIGDVQAYYKSLQKLSLFTVIRSGHVIALDQPEVLLKIVRQAIGK